MQLSSAKASPSPLGEGRGPEGKSVESAMEAKRVVANAAKRSKVCGKHDKSQDPNHPV